MLVQRGASSSLCAWSHSQRLGLPVNSHTRRGCAGALWGRAPCARKAPALAPARPLRKCAPAATRPGIENPELLVGDMVALVSFSM